MRDGLRYILETAGGFEIVGEASDGAGFDPGAPRKSGSFGLVGLRERAYLVGGTLHIDTTLGEGTTVEVDIPVAAAHVAIAHEGSGASRAQG
ncbi:hypothetical protein WJ39_14495 [Burkholderia diffusa]|nr:hypothetical protein WJ39_14495 [Burkholderia diffusa]